MESNFSFKDFEKVRIKATYDMEVGNRKISKGETIVVFDRIQIAGLNNVTKYVTAHGGYEDRDRVFWETQKEEKLTFAQGVFTKEQFALLTNSFMITKDSNSNVKITNREELESDEEGKITLSHVPEENLFVYDARTYEKITDYELEDNIITISEPFKEVIIDYIYTYNNSINTYQLGRNLINGFVSLEGRTRVKDDTTGHVVTGILKIPRLKLMSNLSIRLGKNAVPMVGTFTGTATPVGSRGSTYITEFCILSDDIDSDL